MYPTTEEVLKADRLTICKWYRFLPSPTNDQELQILNLVVNRCNELGGFTPQISKQLGIKNHYH